MNRAAWRESDTVVRLFRRFRGEGLGPAHVVLHAFTDGRDTDPRGGAGEHADPLEHAADHRAGGRGHRVRGDRVVAVTFFARARVAPLPRNVVALTDTS